MWETWLRSRHLPPRRSSIQSGGSPGPSEFSSIRAYPLMLDPSRAIPTVANSSLQVTATGSVHCHATPCPPGRTQETPSLSLTTRIPFESALAA